VSVRHVAFLIKALLVCVLERIFSFFPSLSVTPGELIQHSNFLVLLLSHLHQRRFGLGKPEGHVHSAVEADGHGQGDAALECTVRWGS